MSLPSDNPAVSEAVRRPPSQLTPEQRGMAVAALVAFFGITYIGPALTRLARKPTLKDRMARHLRDTRRQAQKATGKVRKRVRRLGGGTIWR